MRYRFRISVVLIAGGLFLQSCQHSGPDTGIAAPAESSASSRIDDAFRTHASNVMLTAEGTVDRVLADDTSGDRHQKFLVRLPSGLTILVAHNIDIAPRIPGIAKGSAVKFHGEYVWTEKGGTVHWTHRERRGSHESGWIEFNGSRYE